MKRFTKDPIVQSYFDSLATLEGRFDDLVAGGEPETYSQKLMANQNERVKKLGSEVAEFVREDSRPDFDAQRLIGEAADLVYSTEIMLISRGVDFSNVFGSVRRAVNAGWPGPEMSRRMVEDPDVRYCSVAAYAASLIAEECRPDFRPEKFTLAASNLVQMTGIILAGREITMRPVLQELGARNQPSGVPQDGRM